MLNAFPYNNGHVMVAPYEHVGSLEALEAGTSSELIALAQLSQRALGAAYRPDGYNLGLNQGEVAGAGFEGHVHMHVVPRWAGDTNFMPVIGDTRVLPETLGDTLRSLREAFAEVTAGRDERG
jgi:ATP adenylyltransferase